MLELHQKKDCCGCAACQQACPKQCIKMVEDVEGFLYPHIDLKHCINCDLCKRICPIFCEDNQTVSPKREVQAFSAYAKNEKIRTKSSSGGIFSILAEQIIREGGIVFGAAFDDDFAIHHICVAKIDDLYKLRGSKYAQSHIGNAYTSAKGYLDSGHMVLFSGTACQIAGLKGYLRKEYEKLITVDVLCHGTPSPKLWHNYLLEHSHGVKVTTVNFRNKATGWKNYSVQIQTSDNYEYNNLFYKDAFMRLFLANICLRPSCHSCRFKGFPRLSDITLGDCWGIEHHSPEMDDDRGTSIVIVNSLKWQKLRELVSECCVWKKSKLNTILPETADSRKSVVAHPQRRQMFICLEQNKDITDLLKLLEPSCTQKIKNVLRKLKRKLG